MAVSPGHDVLAYRKGNRTMASSRRRFLTTFGAVAAGGAASLGGRAFAERHPSPPGTQAPDMFSPTELLERRATETVAARAAAPGTQSDPRMPTAAEVESWYTDRRNWGRWGDDDQMGAINLITPEKSAAAAALVSKGRKVSMSRVFEPEQHFMRKKPAPRRGKLGRRLLRLHLSRPDDHAHRRAVSHVGHRRDVAGTGPRRRNHDPRCHVRHNRRVERWHHHARCPDRRAAAPERASCHTRPAGAWMGDRGDRTCPRCGDRAGGRAARLQR